MVASSHRFKKTEHSHLRTLLSYVHYKLSSEYRQKRRLRLQNRSAGCVLPRTNTSEQQEVYQVCLQKQGLSVLSTSLRSEHGPSGIYSVGAYRDVLPPLSGDFGDFLTRRLVSSPSRPSSVTSPSVSASKHVKTAGIYLKQKKSELDLVQDIQIQFRLNLGRAYSPLQRGEVLLYSSLRRFPIILVTLHRWQHREGRVK